MTDYTAIKPLSPDDEKLWSTLVHIGGIFFGLFPALIGYLLLKERGPFVRAHTATALNFQISLAIYVFAGVVLSIPLMLVGIGFLTVWLIPSAASVLIFIFSIVAGVKANQGQFYTYPLTITFVS
ncbi:MAG: DUF4870 domain-containing protein [Agromyces sp.]